VIAFSVAGMVVTRHNMGTNDLHRVIEVVDIGHRGQVVRSNRLEYFLTAHSKQVRTEVTHGLWVPVFWIGNESFRPLNRHTVMATCEGTIPNRYVATQHLGQWMSVLYRTLSISGDATAVAPPEERLAPGQVVQLDRNRVRELVIGRDDASMVFVLHHGIEGIGHASRRQLNLIGVLSELKEEQLVSAISPAGDILLEDLAVYDSSNPNEGLLVALQEKGDTTVIYRRLFRWGES
jgi:hypothetical protein